ncbi:hypothetical protein PRZ48_013029 [Zasmidium cellare]|uniref:Uncharacterized protein n=1 Tax=Zasmidium cellare TaxID=395010 RepID=A0ABR0E3G8_ZASCE|nr:hypothetical protein PRZ48_013029 [Zasmidium cellare]
MALNKMRNSAASGSPINARSLQFPTFSLLQFLLHANVSLRLQHPRKRRSENLLLSQQPILNFLHKRDLYQRGTSCLFEFIHKFAREPNVKLVVLRVRFCNTKVRCSHLPCSKR